MANKQKIGEFARAYIEAALWSSTDDDGEPLDQNHDASDIAAKTRREMVRDCNAFRRANKRDLKASGLSESRAGHDFWLTRNGHGAGFWDEYYGDDSAKRAVFKRLTDSAHAYGSYDLYIGDDGKIHGT